MSHGQVEILARSRRRGDQVSIIEVRGSGSDTDNQTDMHLGALMANWWKAGVSNRSPRSGLPFSLKRRSVEGCASRIDGLEGAAQDGLEVVGRLGKSSVEP
jgi:hypothetical protein